jgi:hypothetical protein
LADIGYGKVSINTAASYARSLLEEGFESVPFAAFSSIGTGGRNPQNQERDLHRWLRGALQIDLDVYTLTLPLLSTDAPGAVPTAVPIILPHELLHWLLVHGRENPCIFSEQFSAESLPTFWNNARAHAEWRSHPALQSTDLSKLVPLTLHVDGTEVYTNSEFYIWSWSSPFGQAEVVDCRFLITLIPHSWMGTKALKRHANREIAKVIV